MSLKERLNKIILERTIEYNTIQPQNSTAKETSATFETEAHGKKHQSPPTQVLTCSSQVITCLSYGTSFLAVTIVNNYAVTYPCKIKRGGYFGVLTGMSVFQMITLHKTTNSVESQAKIRFAFHFVERNERHKIVTYLVRDLVQ